MREQLNKLVSVMQERDEKLTEAANRVSTDVKDLTNFLTNRDYKVIVIVSREVKMEIGHGDYVFESEGLIWDRDKLRYFFSPETDNESDNYSGCKEVLGLSREQRVSLAPLVSEIVEKISGRFEDDILEYEKILEKAAV